MRGAQVLFIVLAAIAVSACARQQQTYYIIDPQTGQPVPVATQQDAAQQQYAQQSAPIYQQPQAAPQTPQSGNRGLFSSSPAYAQQTYAPSPQYAQQPYQQPAPAPAESSGGRGLFNFSHSAPRGYAQQPGLQPPYVAQYTPPQIAAPQYGPVGGPYVAAPYGYASAPATYAPAYTLDSGDKLRVVVFGQDGITNSYTVDAGGNVNLPLIGTVPARGYTTQQLSKMIADRLKQGYVREPHVSVEVENYRPFFILGEVTSPGQYPYVANMTAETAIAIAGGFGPRAKKSKVELTRNAPGAQFHGEVPLNFPLRPGDTIEVKERWF
jgi:polysaccharide export outer membrane protein